MESKEQYMDSHGLLPPIDVTMELVDDLNERFIEELKCIAVFRVVDATEERLLKARYLLNKEKEGLEF